MYNANCEISLTEWLVGEDLYFTQSKNVVILYQYPSRNNTITTTGNAITAVSFFVLYCATKIVSGKYLPDERMVKISVLFYRAT